MSELPDQTSIGRLNELVYCEYRFWLMYVRGKVRVNAPSLEGTQQHQRARTWGTAQEGDTVIRRRV